MTGYDDIAYLTAQISSNGASYTVTDPLGNPVQTIQPNASGGGYLIQNVGYDNPWGQPSSITAPHTVVRGGQNGDNNIRPPGT